jgi:hypothetical protein
MNHRHRKILHALFHHPLPSNIAMKDLEAVLGELGATLDNRQKGRVGVTLNGHTAVFHIAQRAIPKEEIVQVRKFLETCGIDPARDYPV